MAGSTHPGTMSCPALHGEEYGGCGTSLRWAAQYSGSSSSPSTGVQVSPTSGPTNACVAPRAQSASVSPGVAGVGPGTGRTTGDPPPGGAGSGGSAPEEEN